MNLELKVLRQNDIPFIPLTTSQGVLVKDKNGNTTSLDNILIKDSDMSLAIENGTIRHTNNVLTVNKGMHMFSHDEHGHITESEEIFLSDDLYMTQDNQIKITYQSVE